ncbi:MAG: hypothetical protein GY942_17575, partial [Aestuariibacter sp.]|nr:hypothetical protein [Aestuariibacter sp.]
GLAATAVSSSFTIDPIGTSLTVETTTPTFASNGTTDLTVNLSDALGRALREKTALLLIENGASTVVYSESIITNLFGNVELQTVPLATGTYTVSVIFGDVVTLGSDVIDLTNPRYLPSSAQLTLISNTPPLANAGGPYTVNEGDTVLLDASGSSDVNAGQALSFAWDLDDNGSYETQGVTTTLTAVTGPANLIVGLEVCDPVDECDTVTVLVTVNSTNSPPVIVDDNATTNEDTAVTVDVLFNDSDPDDDTLAIDSVTQPVSGTAVISGTMVVYTPALNFNGSDS